MFVCFTCVSSIINLIYLKQIVLLYWCKNYLRVRDLRKAPRCFFKDGVAFSSTSPFHQLAVLSTSTMV